MLTMPEPLPSTHEPSPVAHRPASAMASHPTRRYTELPGPTRWPLVGNLLQLDLTAMHDTLQDWAARHGPLYRATIGPYPWIVVSDPALIEDLLKRRPEELRRGAQLSGLLDEVGAKGLFTAEGAVWRAQRKLITRTLTADVVKRFHPTLQGLVARLRQRWDIALATEQPIDLYRDLKAFALDATIALAMGTDVNVLEHPDNPLQRDIDFIFKRVGARLLTPVPYWRHFKLAHDREAEAASARIQRMLNGLIEDARSRLQRADADVGKPRNLLEAMVQTRDEPGSGLTDEAIVGNAVTMVFAGEDTTASTLAWALWYLAQHPQAAQAIADESARVTDGRRGLPTQAQLDEMRYTEAVTLEALRLKPAAPLLAMETLHEQVIGDVLVPAGVQVGVLTGLAGQREDRFAQAARFWPERWIDGAVKGHDAEDARKLMSFGGGQRLCPGRYLSLVEMKTVLSMVASSYTLTLDPKAPPVTERYTFTVNPSALPIALQPRHPDLQVLGP
jgi:cytochrome P450